MKGNADTAHFAALGQNELLSRREIFWNKLYTLLRPLVKHWVHNSGVSSWRGQEDDVAEDIVQDAQLRLYRHMLRAEKGQVSPIEHPERMIIVIARRCFLDKWRKDRRLVRFDSDDRLSLEHVVQSSYC